MVYTEAGGPLENLQAGVGLLEAACDSGTGLGCRLLGTLRLPAGGTGGDPLHGLDLLRQACDLGDAPGCSLLGAYVQNGIGGPSDAVRGAQLMELACDAGNPRACGNLGLSYENGRGTAPNLGKAAARYREACDGGEFDACVYHANTLLRSVPPATAVVPGDPLASLSRACHGHNAEGCRRAGDLLVTGTGAPADPGHAIESFRLACTMGDALGCRNVGRANGPVPSPVDEKGRPDGTCAGAHLAASETWFALAYGLSASAVDSIGITSRRIDDLARSMVGPPEQVLLDMGAVASDLADGDNVNPVFPPASAAALDASRAATAFWNYFMAIDANVRPTDAIRYTRSATDDLQMAGEGLRRRREAGESDDPSAVAAVSAASAAVTAVARVEFALQVAGSEAEYAAGRPGLPTALPSGLDDEGGTAFAEAIKLSAHAVDRCRNP